MNRNENIGILILAAGSSSRLGEPKQNLTYGGETLLQRMIRVSGAVEDAQVLVVTQKGIELNPSEKVRVVINENAELGMSSSIQIGLQSLLEKNQNLEALLITVCDQPFVTTNLLNQIIERYRETGLPIVASHYDETIGTPALFHKSIFPELLALEGDRGAKKIIEKDPGRITKVEFALGKFDIDTKEDFDRLLKMNIHAN